ncbi:SDR family NAD(P)-dependent oxidoreductase [Plantactinospora siamensis]|uniref:SDR family NAD(P)-dependent oxidoreductase n=1 Tax=Plantactinospora siamensis TaxID=555372 RepID=A0ABV6P4S1_9ACTN
MTARSFVVVGGTAGLGLAAARLLVNEHRVTVFGDAPDEVAAVTDELGCAGAVCDVSSYEQVRAAFAEVVDRTGVIAGVAACTARWAGGDLDELSPDQLRRIVEVDVLGATYVLREALRHLRRQGFGTIVYPGAAAATSARPDLPVYRAARSYGTSLVESLAGQRRDDGVRVLLVCPGPMPTRLRERADGELLDEAYAQPEPVVAELVRLLQLDPADVSDRAGAADPAGVSDRAGAADPAGRPRMTAEPSR